MKTPEEIERLGNDYSDKINNEEGFTSFSISEAFVNGYEKCQQDNADKITELWEMIQQLKEGWKETIELGDKLFKDNNDKKYTEEDIRKAFCAGDAWGRADYVGNNQPFADEDKFVQSLNKQI